MWSVYRFQLLGSHCSTTAYEPQRRAGCAGALPAQLTGGPCPTQCTYCSFSLDTNTKKPKPNWVSAVGKAQGHMSPLQAQAACSLAGRRAQGLWASSLPSTLSPEQSLPRITCISVLTSLISRNNVARFHGAEEDMQVQHQRMSRDSSLWLTLSAPCGWGDRSLSLQLSYLLGFQKPLHLSHLLSRRPQGNH